MNEEQASQASRLLLALARRNALVYAAHPDARAIIVTGSAAEGVSDFYSDLDMILYYDKLPSEDELLAACQQNNGKSRHLLGRTGDEEVMDAYAVHGVECQCAHTTIVAWERDIATVLEQLDVTTPLQKALAGMLEAVPLHGEPLVRQWQARLAEYPEALAQAMVEHHLAVFPLWGLQDYLATRDATIWVYEVLVETAHHLLGVLAGLNRQYYSSFQFKRLHHFVSRLTITPLHFADRLEALFRADNVSAATHLEELVCETVRLVDEHMPQVDTNHVRAQLNWRHQAWRA